MLADFIGGYIGSAIGDWRRKRRADRTGRLLCALRVLDGRQAGLSRRWRHGMVKVSPGSIEFDSAKPWARKVTVPVCSASRLHQRQPQGAEAWVVDPRTRIVELDTGFATLEWAVFGTELRGAIEELREPGPVSSGALVKPPHSSTD